MNIDPNDPKLIAYVLGELDQKEWAGIEAQLEKSEELRQAVREIRETTELLTRELQTEPCQALSHDQRRAIEAAAANANGAKTTPHAGRSAWRRLSIPMGLAASVLIILGAWTFMPRLYKSSQKTSIRLATLQPAPADALRRRAANRPDAPSSVAQYDKMAGSKVTAILDEASHAVVLNYVARPVGPGDGELYSGGPEANGVRGKQVGPETLVVQLGGSAGGIVGAAFRVEYDAENLVEIEARKGERYYAYATGDEDGSSSLILGSHRRADGDGGIPKGGLIDPELVALMRRSLNTEAYDQIVENPFLLATHNPLSTFSIDVDTASYANIRRFLTQGSLPPPGAVRIEEMVNYFDYDYPLPTGEAPFSVNVEVADCPWMPGHRLARIGLKGYEVDVEERPAANLVFLLDVSGSMNSPDKLPLLKQAMRMLTTELAMDDRVAIAVYAGASGLVLPSTWCEDQQTILGALNRLQAGGSTNGGAGIQLAYDIASDNYIEGGVNRVILATDGDFNVGITNQGDLISLIEEKAKSGVFLSVLGFGTGNLKDSTMEKLADKGNGNYSYIDTLSEARKVLVEQMGGTLVTIAKDVKIQIEFNPATVGAYRLIGYENRMLRKEDFNDDTKDAGEIGAGHTVTAFYEIVPAGEELDSPTVDPLKYQTPPETATKYESGELMTVKLRYKEPDGDTSRLLEVPVTDAGLSLADASDDFAFGAAVASFGMLLRGSEHCGEFTYGAVLEMADTALGEDPHGYRREFVDLVQRAVELQSSP